MHERRTYTAEEVNEIVAELIVALKERDDELARLHRNNRRLISALYGEYLAPYDSIIIDSA